LYPVIWGIIIAVALYPVAKKLNRYFGNRRGLTAAFLSISLILLIIIPTILFTNSIIDSFGEIADKVENGEFSLPFEIDTAEMTPTKQYIIEKWQSLNQNLEQTLVRFAPQLKQLGQFILGTVASLGGVLVLFIISTIIAGVFLSNAKGGQEVAFRFFKRLTGDRAAEMVALSAATIRSVVKGVIGVAVIQAVLAGIGFFVAGVPGASVLTLIVMFLAIVQIPPIIIMIPVIVYVYSVASSGVFIAFTVWSILVSLSDNFLKPLLLGRGMEIPMLVILIGAIGGMIASGMIGLFIGPVILALGYQLFQAWMKEEEEINQTAENSDVSLSE
jgi:predicted PurR-regulated permease PerM